MIRLDNISKQHGHQILFIDSSMGVQKGEKVGLVGPNGAGKTTLFRMIAGEEGPDESHLLSLLDAHRRVDEQDLMAVLLADVVEANHEVRTDWKTQRRTPYTT